MDEQPIRFYRITAGQAEEYAVPGEGIKTLERGCERSEFQFLTHTPLNVALSENSGLEFPDFLCRFQIPLISDAFKRVLDGAGVDNLFYKAILLTDDTIGTQERYWLALPPRIRCLNRRASTFVDAGVGLPKAEKIVVNPSKVGNYKIFCIEEVVNRDIIITADLKEKIEQAELENILFYPLEG